MSCVPCCFADVLHCNLIQARPCSYSLFGSLGVRRTPCCLASSVSASCKESLCLSAQGYNAQMLKEVAFRRLSQHPCEGLGLQTSLLARSVTDEVESKMLIHANTERQCEMDRDVSGCLNDYSLCLLKTGRATKHTLAFALGCSASSLTL